MNYYNEFLPNISRKQMPLARNSKYSEVTVWRTLLVTARVGYQFFGEKWFYRGRNQFNNDYAKRMSKTEVNLETWKNNDRHVILYDRWIIPYIWHQVNLLKNFIWEGILLLVGMRQTTRGKENGRRKKKCGVGEMREDNLPPALPSPS